MVWRHSNRTNVRLMLRQKPSVSRERKERLRKAHDAAQTLRDAFPDATLVSVHLHFLPVTAPPHAAQSFVMYPAARAFFEYPCPYGDCDGIYELGAAAARSLTPDSTGVSGTVECCGLRCRDGLPRQPCGLRMSYTITARQASAASGVSAPAAG
jgi:hypothetical protein